MEDHQMLMIFHWKSSKNKWFPMNNVINIWWFSVENREDHQHLMISHGRSSNFEDFHRKSSTFDDFPWKIINVCWSSGGQTKKKSLAWSCFFFVHNIPLTIPMNLPKEKWSSVARSDPFRQVGVNPLDLLKSADPPVRRSVPLFRSSPGGLDWSGFTWAAELIQRRSLPALCAGNDRRWY